MGISGEKNMSELEKALRDALLCESAHNDPQYRYLNEKITCQHNLETNSLHVAIAGSDDLRDWWQNFSTYWQHDINDRRWWKLWGSAKATSGYVVGAENCIKLLKKQGELDKGRKIRLTGHSAGGPKATIVGLQLQKQGFNVREIRTFGAPKFSTKPLTEFMLLNSLHRYVAEDDPIPLWPPSRPWRAWRHHGTEHRVGDPVDNHIGVVRDSIEAHLMPNYISSIRRALDESF